MFEKKRYGYGSDDSINIKLKQYNTATQGHRNSLYKDFTSKKAARLPELHRSNSNLQSNLLQHRRAESLYKFQDESLQKTTSGRYKNKSTLTNKLLLYQIKLRNNFGLFLKKPDSFFLTETRQLA